jgi:uncharacterized HhH-GPD family protein
MSPRANRPRALVETLLAFGARLEAGRRAAEGSALDPVADALTAADPFAFLVGVLADQGMRSERAWRVPFDLRTRLGHLDPARIARSPRAVARAFARRPVLHRYVNTIPRYVVSAARRVLATYGDDAGAIWGDRPTAAALRARFEAFDGIGQKKAAMAVELLVRERGVVVRELAGSDVALDVHLRRTLLRIGLARRDDPRSLVEAARRAHPARPGALNLPLWTIGRTWCRPRRPACGACVLASCCARRGVGSPPPLPTPAPSSPGPRP